MNGPKPPKRLTDKGSGGARRRAGWKIVQPKRECRTCKARIGGDHTEFCSRTCRRKRHNEKGCRKDRRRAA